MRLLVTRSSSSSFSSLIMVGGALSVFFHKAGALAIRPPSSTTSSTELDASSSTVSSTSTTTSSTLWGDVPAGPPDAILGIASAFRACTDERKVNVCVGAYRDSAGQPWVLPSVREAERRMLKLDENKEYLPIEGDAAYVTKALQFAYGPELEMDKVAGVQTLSGTGACRVGGTFLARFCGSNKKKKTHIYIPTPTWGNHWKIFDECGLDTHPYRYYDWSTNRLDFDGLMQDLRQAPKQSIVLLHSCAHNPTGCDPTMDQWKEIYALLAEKQHVAFFDSAYQGFASGNAEHDAAALRYFVSQQQQQESPSNKLPGLLLAQSFAKNFGLYGERTGTLSVLCDSADEADRVMSQLRLIIRPMYSSPPKHGSSIVKTILSDEGLTAQYYKECQTMASRIQDMRTRLVQELADVGSQHDWSHVLEQIGMFAFTGMSAEMCDVLTKDYAIYLTRDGRISVAGLNEGNVRYVAEAVHAVTDGKSITG